MAEPGASTSPDDAQPLRLDKWLWYARFFKSRGLASKLLAAGKLRQSGTVVTKAHQKVRIGDVLTFPQGPNVRVVKVVAYGTRRGPAPEARTLYEDLAPPPEPGAPKSEASAEPAPDTPRREKGRRAAH